MEFDRRVQIRVACLIGGERMTGAGSGYLVAPRLVLTAAHVLDDPDPAADVPLTVSRPDADDTRFPALVRWQRTDDLVDAALIEIEEDCGWPVPPSLGDLLSRPPQRYGRLIGTRPHPVTALGFPRMQKDIKGGRRLDEQLSAHIAPGTGSLAGRYELSGTDPTVPLTQGSAGTAWSGMSGAPVLAEDGLGGSLLCGVIRRDRQARAGSRLTATTAAELLADPGFSALLAEHTGRRPALEPAEPAPLLAPAAVEHSFRSPVGLLSAHAETVAFQGRTDELNGLRTWCESGPQGLSVRVVTGPGGQGKTRLARRLTAMMAEDGWVTGHLRSDLGDRGLDDFAPLRTALPLLLVVDYAETRPYVVRRLLTALYRSPHRVRVLLLARSDGAWRTSSLEALREVAELLDLAQVVPLDPLLPARRSADDRRDAFRAAAVDLARLLPRVLDPPQGGWDAVAAGVEPPAALADALYGNVLTLQMAALVALLQRGPQPAEAAADAPLEHILLGHEKRLWEVSARTPAYDLGLTDPALSAAVAVAALGGAATENEAVAVLAVLDALPAGRRADTARWLASLYPSRGDRYFGSPEPDRIAEYHAAEVLAKGGFSLPALLSSATPEQQTQTLVVLLRAVLGHYNSDRVRESRDLLALLTAEVAPDTLDRRALRSVMVALPATAHITAPLSARLGTALVRAEQGRGARGAAAARDLASARMLASAHLATAGQDDEALADARAGVRVLRRLALRSPAHRVDLAVAMIGLSDRLWKSGRERKALKVLERAVMDLGRHMEEEPDVHQIATFAHAVGRLATRLWDMGARTRGLEFSRWAVSTHRRLFKADPVAYGPPLGQALHDLAALLGEGHVEEALAVAEEAVAVRRGLANDDPSLHRPGLALSLHMYGHLLVITDEWSRGIEAVREAAELYRRLYDEAPGRFGEWRARVQSDLGQWLGDNGHYREALKAFEVVVEMYREPAWQWLKRQKEGRPLVLGEDDYFLVDYAEAQFRVAVVRAQTKDFLGAQTALDQAALFARAGADRWSELLQRIPDLDAQLMVDLGYWEGH
ncbi:trypsin-like peptidase domain-containing protein [Streptomyces sp. NPDC046887]|uniref:trypsin-like peptidase domain-containing protein n=1 Tax=Streptomyces sp. NPDC046887 TaxID=3155472 RepID=UPI0033D2C66A